ncbi:TIGR03757 family integrating conjugative element protein [Xanthomonas campestris pv. campestris]|nr:TIGR03757 family integrating conjugative element protein [Xanthomonas campestris pv. campestris]
MPVLSLNLPAASRCPLAAVLCLALLAPVAVAADVLVVTDSRHPVQAPAGVRVIELDQPAHIEAQLTARLPADPAQAEALVRQRLLDGGADLQRRIGQAYQGVANAWGLGIVKIPAVVVDRRYVVYGEPDVSRAVARIDAYRSARP